VLAAGIMATVALQAAQDLAAQGQGLELEVINARFVKPLDGELLLAAIQRHKKICTIEENVLAGGFGSSILELMEANGISRAVNCIALPDRFIEAGPRPLLLDTLGLSRAALTARLRAVFTG
jgi:1-deoxy-D-xylulose-5-phosphate synthase